MSTRVRDDVRHALYLWVEWVDAGCPSESPIHFNSVHGLCYNVAQVIIPRIKSAEHNLERELQAMFEEDNLSIRFPFNTTGEEYYDEKDSTKNEVRVLWARKHAKGKKSRARKVEV